jgi:hypothetical protein
LEVSHRVYSYKSNFDIIVRIFIIIIKLRVMPEFTNVGLAVWDAGYYISEVVLANQDMFSDKTSKLS